MNQQKLLPENSELLVKHEQIQQSISELAEQLNNDYDGKEVQLRRTAEECDPQPDDPGGHEIQQPKRALPQIRHR